ncbi:hypothetical protein [Smaragdicoccus niigatensis]|uniref:hypothetical protein n=1 Tax=Smaragdicoccus niigatensis TaxID=359359 RepID=UPI00036BA25A|nr:hypothetical protein [Smaragdicoccus niigatensis]
MAAVAVVLTAVNLVLLLVLLALSSKARKRADDIGANAAVASAAVVAPVSVAQELAGGRNRVIAIEILNPVELASSQVKFAGVVGGIAPGAIRKVVYEQAVKMMKEQFEKEGVKADVRIHVAN